MALPSGTRVTLMLCDSAQVAEGKLYILGAGWSIIGADPVPMAIAAKIEVPYTGQSADHHWEIELTDEDGGPVFVPTADGNQVMIVPGDFRVEGEGDLAAGTMIDIPLAINFGPLPLPPGHRYMWRMTVDGETNEEWTASFTIRPVDA